MSITRREMLKTTGRPRILPDVDPVDSVGHDQDRLCQPDHRSGVGLRRARCVRDRPRPRSLQERPVHRGHQLLGGDRLARRAVHTVGRCPGRERSDPVAEGRPHAGDLDTGNSEPRLRRLRGSRRSLRLDRRALGGLVPGTRGQSRPAFAIQVDLPLLLWRGAVLPCVHPPVATGHDQQEGRRDVAERRRRQRHPRCARAVAQAGRVHDRRPRAVRGRNQRLQRADRALHPAGLPDLQYVSDSSRLCDFLAPGGAAGVHEACEDRPDRQDGPLSVAGHGPRCDRQRPRVRRLLGSDMAV